VQSRLTSPARTGFFKPVHVKSLSADGLRSLIIARQKLVEQRRPPTPTNSST
jgi:transposase